MRVIVTMLISLLILLSFSACSEKVYLKCQTPNVEKPVIDNEPQADILENVKRALINYELMRNYSLKLEESNRVCK